MSEEPRSFFKLRPVDLDLGDALIQVVAATERQLDALYTQALARAKREFK